MPYWTAESDDLLRTMFAEGRSFGQMAVTFAGSVSRGAIIGRAHRLGLRRGRPANNRKKKEKVMQAPTAVSKPKQGQDGGSNTQIAQRLAIRASIPAPVMPPPAPVAIPEHSGPIKLVDLTIWHCRWPIGDPRDPDFGFCGARKEIERSYCEEHRRIAYVPAAARSAA